MQADYCIKPYLHFFYQLVKGEKMNGHKYLNAVIRYNKVSNKDIHLSMKQKDVSQDQCRIEISDKDERIIALYLADILLENNVIDNTEYQTIEKNI